MRNGNRKKSRERYDNYIYMFNYIIIYSKIVSQTEELRSTSIIAITNNTFLLIAITKSTEFLLSRSVPNIKFEWAKIRLEI